METPEYYLGEFERLGLADLQITANTELQWKQLRVELTEKQKQLLLLRSQISRDEKAIRADANHGDRSWQRQQLASYARVTRYFDDWLVRIEEAKLALEMYLQQLQEAAPAPAHRTGRATLSTD